MSTELLASYHCSDLISRYWIHLMVDKMPQIKSILHANNCYNSTKYQFRRIFRGYVARNQYKYLLKEERQTREDHQKAAIEIQR